MILMGEFRLEEPAALSKKADFPRERFFGQMRKADDGVSGATRRGGMTTYGRKRSEGRPESFVDHAG